jgi:hypothetical protein
MYYLRLKNSFYSSINYKTNKRRKKKLNGRNNRMKNSKCKKLTERQLSTCVKSKREKKHLISYNKNFTYKICAARIIWQLCKCSFSARINLLHLLLIFVLCKMFALHLVKSRCLTAFRAS